MTDNRESCCIQEDLVKYNLLLFVMGKKCFNCDRETSFCPETSNTSSEILAPWKPLAKLPLPPEGNVMAFLVQLGCGFPCSEPVFVRVIKSSFSFFKCTGVCSKHDSKPPNNGKTIFFNVH